MDGSYTSSSPNLQENHIRLVKLEHSPPSSPLKCRLQSHALDDTCPAYVALSYTWGAKERYADIHLNGHVFPIGHSLWSFLEQMRAQHLYITFWIDALSINQANVLERNQQVQMMRRIFTHAHSVWIWLGEADGETHSDMAMQYLKTREPFGDNKEVIYKKLWSPRKARAVLGLCERSYWKRVWIVQEVMLAQKATILCGEMQVPWINLERLIADLQTISDRGRALHSIGVSDVLDTPAAVIVKAKAAWNGSVQQPLATLLEQYRDQQAADLRDKVYALHGLACDGEGIAVDYRIRTKALLVEVIYHTCSAQKGKKKKELLRFAGMMKDVLRVACEEEELGFHIAVARGEGSMRDRTDGQGVRLGGSPYLNLAALQRTETDDGERTSSAGMLDSLGTGITAEEEAHDVDDERRGIGRDERFDTTSFSASSSLDAPDENVSSRSPTASHMRSLSPISSMVSGSVADPHESTQSSIVENASVHDSLDMLAGSLKQAAASLDQNEEVDKVVETSGQGPQDVDTLDVASKGLPSRSIPVRQVRFDLSEPALPSEDLEHPFRQPESPPAIGELQKVSPTGATMRKNFSALQSRPSEQRADVSVDENSATRYETSSIVMALRSSGTVLSGDDIDSGGSINSDSASIPVKQESLLQTTIAERLKHEAELQEVRESLKAALSSGDNTLIAKIQHVERTLAARFAQYSVSTLTYDCVFWFLNCPFKSLNEEKWKTHTLSHFNGIQPPRAFECHLCPSYLCATYQSATGHETWTHRLNHYLSTHAWTGWSFITLPPPDMPLFQFLRENTLITEQEYKTLVTRGWLPGTPRTYVQSRSSGKKKGKKKAEESLWSLVRDVDDSKERHAVRSVLKGLGLR